MASASAQPSYLQLLTYMRLRVDAGEAQVPPWMIPGWIHPRDPYAQTPEDFAASLLPLAAADGTTAWYAFHWARPKNAGDRRRSRVVTGGGSWKSDRAAVPVNSTVDGAVVQAGWRTPFAYTIKIPGGGEHRPGWVMQELLLPDDAGVVGLQELALSKIYRSPWGKNRSCSFSPAASLAAGACSFSPAASLAAGACSASPAAFSLAPEASSASPAAAPEPSSSSSAAAPYLAPGPSSAAAAAAAYLAPRSSPSASLAASLAAEAPSLASSAAAALAAEATSSMTPFTTNLGVRTSSASAAPAAAAMGLTDPPSPPRRWLVVPVGAHGSPPRPGDSFCLAELLGLASQEEREPEAEGERGARTYNNKRVAGNCVAWILEAAGGAKKPRAA